MHLNCNLSRVICWGVIFKRIATVRDRFLLSTRFPIPPYFHFKQRLNTFCISSIAVVFKLFSQILQTHRIERGWDLAEWLERLTANAVVATVLGSIPASSDTVKSEGRQMKQCWISEIKRKNPKKSPMMTKLQILFFLFSFEYSNLCVHGDYALSEKSIRTGHVSINIIPT